MIRVVYRWQVANENLVDFKKEWSVATNKIHESVPGALGSFMLQDLENDNEILTIAKWDSIESWRAFWGMETPKEMENMHKLGTRISAKAYSELDDYTR
ncbi:antibiotic biosynthesis monooxygenase [Alteromonadaceae bacterium M269]|nr:antibiotic biosynthesis monooxygenase [Alteromonadaceae bacterium M269]